jgi:site-specific recombinase XerC
VLPALGALRLREITVPRLDKVIQTLLLRHGAATAKIARTVVSGSLGWAVRQDALPSNPTRDIGRIATAPRRPPRALATEERQEWIARLHADPEAVRKDLPDLCQWMLGTGVRIGEALGELDRGRHRGRDGSDRAHVDPTDERRAASKGHQERRGSANAAAAGLRP